MPNNNPGGVNSYGGFGHEAPYGQIEREKVLNKAVPAVKTPGGNAPKKAQRAAVKGKPAPTQGTAPAAATAAAPTVIPPSAQVAQFWASVAADPDASPLVRQMAQEAMRG